MLVYYDLWGNSLRLTDERVNHILEHPEMINEMDKITDTLTAPDYVIQSKSDNNVILFNKFYIMKQFGGKFLCVVVKYLENDAFIVTSYISKNLPKGDILWQKN